MNGNILQKCVDKLREIDKDTDQNKEISYVLGMLEALLEMQPGEKKVLSPTTTPPVFTPPSPSIKNTEVKTGEMDEGAILEVNMLANLNKVDKSAIQTEQL